MREQAGWLCGGRVFGAEETARGQGRSARGRFQGWQGGPGARTKVRRGITNLSKGCQYSTRPGPLHPRLFSSETLTGLRQSRTICPLWPRKIRRAETGGALGIGTWAGICG